MSGSCSVTSTVIGTFYFNFVKANTSLQNIYWIRLACVRQA